MLVVVGAAPVAGSWTPDPLVHLPTTAPARRDDTAPSREAVPATTVVHHLPGAPQLGEQLAALAQPALAGTAESCLVVTDASLAPPTSRAVQFARQAVRDSGLTLAVIDASPLRIAVVGAALAELSGTARLPTTLQLLALHHLAQQTWSVLVTRSVRRLRRPRPTLRQRYARRRPDELFVTGDRSDAMLCRLPRNGEPAAHLLPPMAPDSTVVTLARGRRNVDVLPIVDRLRPADTVDTSNDPSWWRQWGNPDATELVVRPADVAAVASVIRASASVTWPCSWCGTRLFSLTSCPRCRADFRGSESQHREQRSAA